MSVKKVPVVMTPRWQVTAIGSHKSPKFDKPKDVIGAALQLLAVGSGCVISFGGVGVPSCEVRKHGDQRSFVVFDAAAKNMQWHHIERGLIDAGLVKESGATQSHA